MFLDYLIILLENPIWKATKSLSLKSVQLDKSPLKSFLSSSKVSKTSLFTLTNIVGTILLSWPQVLMIFFISYILYDLVVLV